MAGFYLDARAREFALPLVRRQQSALHPANATLDITVRQARENKVFSPVALAASRRNVAGRTRQQTSNRISPLASADQVLRESKLQEAVPPRI